VVKNLPYRGDSVLWSNRYHFAGGTPADSAHWTTLADAVVTAEKALYTPGVSIVEVIGYEAGSEVPVFTKNYATAGTGVFTNERGCPGDCAALVRYSTDQRTAKNHPIYLFNYYHNVQYSSALTADDVVPGQLAAYGTYAGLWIAGFSDGTNTLKRAGPNGAVALGEFVSPYVHHRDFPR